MRKQIILCCTHYNRYSTASCRLPIRGSCGDESLLSSLIRLRWKQKLQTSLSCSQTVLIHVKPVDLSAELRPLLPGNSKAVESSSEEATLRQRAMWLAAETETIFIVWRRKKSCSSISDMGSSRRSSALNHRAELLKCRTLRCRWKFFCCLNVGICRFFNM